MAMEKRKLQPFISFRRKKRKDLSPSSFQVTDRSTACDRSGPINISDREGRIGSKKGIAYPSLSLQNNIAHNAANNNTITTMKHNSAFLKAYINDTPFLRGSYLKFVRTLQCVSLDL